MKLNYPRKKTEKRKSINNHDNDNRNIVFEIDEAITRRMKIFGGVIVV